MTAKEIKDVIKSLMDEADACHKSAHRSFDVVDAFERLEGNPSPGTDRIRSLILEADQDEFVRAEQRASLLEDRQALYEIAYQLAIQNERGGGSTRTAATECPPEFDPEWRRRNNLT